MLSRFHITSARTWEGPGAPLIFLKKRPREVEGYVDEFTACIFVDTTEDFYDKGIKEPYPEVIEASD